MENQTVAVRVYQSRMDAEVGRMMLEASGVTSFISADDAGGAQPFLTTASGVKLLVMADEFERADDILRVSETDTPGA